MFLKGSISLKNPKNPKILNKSENPKNPETFNDTHDMTKIPKILKISKKIINITYIYSD